MLLPERGAHAPGGSPSPPRRVLLADDHLLFRESVKALLVRANVQVVAEAAEGGEAVRLAGETQPDIAILDFRMPVLNGPEAAEAITRISPGTRTILLTMYGGEPFIARALQAGVSGYVLKSQSPDDLLRAIEEVAAGRIYLGPDISASVAQAWLSGDRAAGETLSARECEVLRLVAEGRTTREAAAVLGISVHTAEGHRARIMTKLGIRDTAGLVRYAVRQGLISP